MSPSTLALAFAGFAVVSTEFVIVGLLPALARDLGVSPAEAGLLVTLFAAVVAVAGPPLTALAARFERRRLFVALLGVFVLANVAAAAAPGYGAMATARVAAALALPVFWSMAAATAARLAAPGQEGRAVAAVFAGISAATVLGIPAGTFVAEFLGWRAAFAAMAVVSALAMAALWRGVPETPGDAPAGGAWAALREQAGVLRDGRFRAHLLLSALAFTAMFAGYTYLAEALAGAGWSGAATGQVLVLFGAAGLLGNWAAGRVVDRAPLVATAGAAAAIGAASLALAPALTAGGVPAVLLLGLWGVAHAAGFLVNQVRVMAAALEAARAFAASLNVSVCSLGIALGAALGGAANAAFGTAGLGLAAMAAAVPALALAAALGRGVARVRAA
jgi:predicted MFS family arabinose efflux permease